MGETAKGKKNPAPFTIWTSFENVEKWKRYRELKKNEFKSQNDFVVTALNEYMENHPVSNAEKLDLLMSLQDLGQLDIFSLLSEIDKKKAEEIRSYIDNAGEENEQ